MGLIAEYIWLDAQGGFRSKYRILPEFWQSELPAPERIPSWNFDGSSTGQATSENSDVDLRPVAVYRSPWQLPHVFVLCECVFSEKSNLRDSRALLRAEIELCSQDLAPAIGFEQEYALIDPKTLRTVGLSNQRIEPFEVGPYYCGNGAYDKSYHVFMLGHLEACLKTGLAMAGANLEVCPGQFEFQVGPQVGSKPSDSFSLKRFLKYVDDLIMARFLLIRVAESEGLEASFVPKPAGAKFNGSGCHANFSCNYMRGSEKDNTIIDRLYDLLRKEHMYVMHQDFYGKGNLLRLTGKHETSDAKTFTIGNHSRSTSLRTGGAEREYLEDRRPAANCDPYRVAKYLLTCMREAAVDADSKS